MAVSPALPVQYAPRWVVRTFFGVLLLLGALLVADYGVSWDEPVDHINGLVSLRYIADKVAPAWSAQQLMLQNAPLLEGYIENDHGALFEIPVALLDVVRPGTDTRAYYLMRHFCTFLVCLGGVWALYRLAVLRFRNHYLALLTAGLFVLSPRMFAESFYNAKDLVFLAAFTLGMYTLARLLARPTFKRALLHGVATGMAIDIRILGSMLVPFTLTLLVLELVFPTAPAVSRRRLLAIAGSYLLCAVASTIAGWPYLWAAPLDHFLTAFEHMQRFRWDGQVLYWGRQESSLLLPWHYAPVWLLITTPVTYSVAAALGLLGVAGRALQRPVQLLRTYAGRLDLLFSGWLLLPFLLVISFKSVIYDGWRHLYFVYPALLLLAVGAGWQLWHRGRSTKLRPVLLGLGAVVGLEAGVTAVRMVLMHPNQQVYFSFLPAEQVEQLFERDYWGLSYRQGLEYLVRQHPQGQIFVEVAHVPPFENNRAMLSAADRQRLVVNPTAPGRYYLTSYRDVAGKVAAEMGEEVYAVKANGITIFSVCRRK